MKQQMKLREWAEQIEARRASGMTVQSWCAENGMNVKTYYYHLRKVREQCMETVPEIVPLTMPQQTKEQAVPSVVETVSVPAHQRKKKRTHEEWMSSLPVEEVRHEEEQPVCEKCGSEMKEIGEEKVYDELVYTPAKFHVRRHIAKKYKCVNCG